MSSHCLETCLLLLMLLFQLMNCPSRGQHSLENALHVHTKTTSALETMENYLIKTQMSFIKEMRYINNISTSHML